MNTNSGDRPDQLKRSFQKPSEFMRARRPEAYSDSIETTHDVLDRSLFEYHLDTITSRSEEKSFEHFCRRLAQKEICPNLLPQTGPTGGGDSKVDTETYPVSTEISDCWYHADANAGASRWAFAISAKKDWRSKVKSDVKGISSTGRPYALIYFISNQFIRDKARSETECSLSKEFSIPVRILDRTWIIDRVFEKGHQRLAIDSLGVTVSQTKKVTKTGPNDLQRQAELELLENQIADPAYYQGLDYELAEDCLASATLSRELGHDRITVDGKFARAERIAARTNSSQQILRILYDRAWTSCYWFDDYDGVVEVYPEIEKLALESDQANDLERLLNIWTLLLAGSNSKVLNGDAIELWGKAARIKQCLGRLASLTHRPNNAAHAKYLLLSLKLTEALPNANKVSKVLGEFRTHFTQIGHLGGYPFDHAVRYFEAMGEFIGEIEGYDAAFETLLPIIEQRRSETAGGEALFNRGVQRLEKGSFYDAIDLLGRAQSKFIKEECQHDLVFALVAIGRAYSTVSLIWAAHAALVAAASLAFADFHGNGRVERAHLYVVRQLIWVELQLGRIPQALTYLNFAGLLADRLKLEGDALETFTEERLRQDGVLGMLLLKSSPSQLEAMQGLPGTLMEMQLNTAAMALLYALGQEETLFELEYVPAGTKSDEIDAWMRALDNQPAKDDIATSPEIFADDVVILRSRLLGCHWEIHVENRTQSVLLAEAVMGFLESLLATSLEMDATPFLATVKIGIGQSSIGQEKPFSLRPPQPGFVLDVVHDENISTADRLLTPPLRDFLTELLSELLPQLLFSPDLASYFARIAEKEEGFRRALDFADIFTSKSNLFRETDTGTLAPWLKTDQLYPPKRNEALNFTTDDDTEEPIEFGTGSAPENFLHSKNRKHSERRILSVIDLPSWDEASWHGLMAMTYPDVDYPPIVCLVFNNEAGARRIFEGWQRELGRKDLHSRIHIAIIKGIDRASLLSYKVVVGSSVSKAGTKKETLMFSLSRFKRIDPASDTTLRIFESQYRKYGCYYLAPAVLRDGQAQPEILDDLAILKRNVSFRQAWQIGENDPDGVAITEEDNPVIPRGITDPPVLQVLRRKAN